MNILGKLSWSAFRSPADRMGTWPAWSLSSSATLAWITAKRIVAYLWREWLTSVDHKRIGVMYLVLALVMLCAASPTRS